MNDRGRVPFALVGVLLVLTSTTIAVTTVTRPPEASPHIDDAMQGATAAAVTELRGAADEAAREAAIAPVTDPADTPAGRAIGDDEPFRDALRLRLYLRAVERIDGTETTRGSVTATASLPAVDPTTAGYRQAIERVEVERAGEDDAAMRVEIEGVRLRAIRNDRTVASVERSPEFVVANPVLALHDRTERFERRANAPVTKPGLGQRLTTRLYAIAWIRGYAQYGGADIATVLGTRHVELSTNDALLAEQRSTFGEADPGGENGVSAAAGRVATTDLIAGLGGEPEWQDAVLKTTDEIRVNPPPERSVGTWREEPDDPTITVGVNASADRAFADTIGVRGRDRLDDAVERVHTVEARVEASSDLRSRNQWGGGSPGGNWTHTGVRTDTRTSTHRISSRGPSETGWETVDGGTFEVTRTRTVTRRWQRGNDTMTTRETEERIYRVEVAVHARTAPIEGVPDGRLDGHLRDATDRAAEDAIGNGGLDGIARRAAGGRTIRSTARATGSPSMERAAIESDLGTVRDRTRAVRVTLPAPAVGTGRANPAERLHRKIGSQRDELLIDADRTARERTRLAVRLEYLDSLDSELETRTDTFDAASDGIGDAVGKHIGSDRLGGALDAHRAASNPSADRVSDPAGNLSMAVDTAPSYLTTSEVTQDRIDEPGAGTIYPLSTRSINVFSSPHGQVADGIVSRLPFLGTGRVSLSTAARTLAAAEAGGGRYEELEGDVEDSTAYVRGELIDELVDTGVSEHDARAALRTDASTADEALMLTNGTTIERAAAEIDGPATTERLELRLRTRLDAELTEAAARPSEPTTTEAQQRIQAKYRTELKNLLADGIESEAEQKRKKELGERLGSIPAGLPLAPVPGYWYATANVWYVTVDGQYERFAVRTNRGDGTGATTYLRNGRTAWVTHGGDEQRLGTSEQVSFRTQTAVVVVVPPGPRGVGDTDGEPYKYSPGWDSGA
ncbi:MAG: hypothetical protein RI560_06580 [Natronomonas sp.]|nr:hypothetical protein [Natronomonas sp.]